MEVLTEEKVPVLRFPEFEGEWKEKLLKELYPNIRNGFVGTATPFYTENGTIYLQGKDVQKGKITPGNLVYINKEFHAKSQKSRLLLNDIVVVQSGHVGECALITEEYVDANCHALIVMTPSSEVFSKFYVYYLYSDKGKKQIHTIKTGNTIEHILASD